MKVYQALMETGEILECDSFKGLFKFALSHAKGELYYSAPDELLTYLCRLCIAEYTEETVLNRWGYQQHELLNRQEIGVLCVSRLGYVLEYNRVLEVEKGV